MKHTLRSILAALLVAVMLLTMSGAIGAFASDDGEEEFLENSICYPDDDTLGANEPVEGEQTEFFEMDIPEGEPEAESLDAVSSPLDGEEETLGADDEEYFPDNTNSGPADVDDTLGGDGEKEDDTLGAGASVTASKTSLTLKAGETASVTLRASGFKGSIYLSYSSNNTKAFTCTWGSWSGLSIPLRVKANSSGEGTITVYMKSASNNKVLDSVKIKVKVQPAKTPSITLSTSSVNIAQGQSQKVNVTVKDYSGACYLRYGNANGTAVGCSWGNWSGMTIPLTITGKNAGSSKITIYLYSSAGRQLANATISASVYKPDNPKITLSAASVSLKTGNSTTVKVTPSGYSGECFLSYSQTNSSAYKCTWGSWSGGGIPLTVTGKNQGSGTITVYMKSKNGTVLTSGKITVQVTPEKKPEVKASRSSVSVVSGASQAVELSYSNVSESIYLQYSTTNSSAFQCSWGNWSGGRIPLTITGKSPGTGRITVYLKRASNKETLASVSVNVSITGLSMQNVGFGFGNYSKPNISLSLCKYMFGNTAKAVQVYNANIGNGGVCFGFASGSALLDAKSNAPYVSSFSGGRSSVSQLQKSDWSSGYGLSVSDYIEALQISQVANVMTEYSGLDSLVSTVKQQTDAGIPVLICIYGQYLGRSAGHAVLAFGYQQVSGTECRIRIYDSNHVTSPGNMEETTLYVKKSSSSGSYNSWSYTLWSGLTWGSGVYGSDIGYVTYNTILSVWNNRGNLKTSNLNLVSTTENDFSFYNFQGDLVVRYADGEMIFSGDGVTEVEKYNLTPDGVGRQANMFYAPTDLYTVVDESPDTPMEITVADDALSVRLSTDADTFDLCADEASNIANALLTPAEGSQYTVSLGTIIDGNYEEISIEGLGTGEAVSLGLDNGELSITGADAASLSIQTLGDSYSIDADCTEGGTISNKGSTEYAAGLNARYEIRADEGYKIQSVIVDGEDLGPVDEYYFEDIRAYHKISAFFVKDISLCTLDLSESAYHFTGKAVEPAVVLRDGENILVEGDDYTVSYEKNTEIGNALIHVTAASNSGYYGVISKEFEVLAPVFGTPDATLPAELMKIEESAFEGITAKIILVPDSCISIGDYAFRNSAVEQIHIPESCSIADHAFDGCEAVLIFGTAGSPAEIYCNTHDNCIFVEQEQ